MFSRSEFSRHPLISHALCRDSDYILASQHKKPMHSTVLKLIFHSYMKKAPCLEKSIIATKFKSIGLVVLLVVSTIPIFLLLC